MVIKLYVCVLGGSFECNSKFLTGWISLEIPTQEGRDTRTRELILRKQPKMLKQDLIFIEIHNN